MANTKQWRTGDDAAEGVAEVDSHEEQVGGDLNVGVALAAEQAREEVGQSNRRLRRVRHHKHERDQEACANTFTRISSRSPVPYIIYYSLTNIDH